MAAEERLNRNFANQSGIAKAWFLTCLFLFTTAASSNGQAIPERRANIGYDLVLNLKISQAKRLLATPGTPQEEYVALLANSLELLLTEDKELFNEYEQWIEQITNRRLPADDAYGRFVHAEAHLQWSFVCVRFGREIDGATHLRRAYQIAEDLRKEFPDFVPVRKTYGILQVILGAVPDRYSWLLALFGMEGSIENGLGALQDRQLLQSQLKAEAKLLYALIQGFILQRPDSGRLALEKWSEGPDYLIRLYVKALLAMKDAQSEIALSCLARLPDNTETVPLHFAKYLLGEIHLHKAEYTTAISYYRHFIDEFKGNNFRKAAWYKMGLCCWLNGHELEARQYFERARQEGTVLSEADRAAASELARPGYPNIPLTKARFAMDGGYYSRARSILDSVSRTDLISKQDQVEYFYRKARLEHALNQHLAAKLFYRQTIDMAGDEPWYFAPNACLQLGYLLLSENDVDGARQYFRRALTYRRHQYKNSIDSKARSALNRLD